MAQRQPRVERTPPRVETRPSRRPLLLVDVPVWRWVAPAGSVILLVTVLALAVAPRPLEVPATMEAYGSVEKALRAGPSVEFGQVEAPVIDVEAAVFELEEIISYKHPALFEGLTFDETGDEIARRHAHFLNAFLQGGEDEKGEAWRQEMWQTGWWFQEASKEDTRAQEARVNLAENLDQSARSGLTVQGIPWIGKAITGLESLGFPDRADALKEDAKEAIRAQAEAQAAASAKAEPASEKQALPEPETKAEASKDLPKEEAPVDLAEPEEAEMAVVESEEESPSSSQMVYGYPYRLGVDWSPAQILLSLRQLYDWLRGQPVDTTWYVTEVWSEEYQDPLGWGLSLRVYYITLAQDPEGTTDSMTFALIWQGIGPPLEVGDTISHQGLVLVIAKLLGKD